MSTEADWPAGVGRIVLERTDSTMAEARRRAGELSGPTWIMARHQSEGHGRRGRPWQTGAGNLAATLVMRPPGGEAAAAAQRSFVAALALREALSDHVAPDRLALKWPNDVLLDGGKLAGILLEASGRGGKVERLAIGVGVNLASAPPPEAVEPGALRPVALDPPVPPEPFLARLAAAFAAHEARFCARGFAPIRADWLAAAARLGAPIRARTGREEIAGIFETVDEAGALVLGTPGGRKVLPAAEIHF